MTCSSVSVFASSNITPSNFTPYLQTNNGLYWTNYNGTSSTVTSGTKLSDLIGQLGGNVTQSLSYIYQRVNSILNYVDGLEGYVDGLEGYVDGIEGTLTNINNKLPASTWFDTINSYVDGIEGYIDGLETSLSTINGNITDIETLVSTSNTKLTDIKSAIESITTYNYTNVLNSIKSNTDHLSVIDTYTQSIQDSIGYGSSGGNVLSKLTSLINSNSNIDTNTSNINTYIRTNTGKGFVNYLNRYFTNNDNTAYPTLTVTSNQAPFAVRTWSKAGSDIQMYRSTHGGINVDSIIDGLNVINSNYIFNSFLLYGSSYYRYTPYQIANGTQNPSTITYMYSIADFLNEILNITNIDLGRLTYILADDNTINAKKANANQSASVLTNFTGSGDASASASDFGNIKDSVGIVKTGLNTNVSVSNIFNIFNNNDGYGFWSDDTRNELNSTRSNRNNLKARGVSNTPLYDAKINELYNAMGVKHE